MKTLHREIHMYVFHTINLFVTMYGDTYRKLSKKHPRKTCRRGVHEQQVITVEDTKSVNDLLERSKARRLIILTIQVNY